MMHLRDSKGRLKEGVRNMRSELAEYGVDVDPRDENGGDDGGRSARARSQRDRKKEQTMREMARVYREMEHQIGEAMADLERLGKA